MENATEDLWCSHSDYWCRGSRVLCDSVMGVLSYVKTLQGLGMLDVSVVLWDARVQ